MLEINRDHKKYIYGAGFAAKVLASYLIFCCNQKISALVVSDGHKEFEQYKFLKKISNSSIPILEWSEIKKENRPIDFYVTLDKGKEQVCSMLSQWQNFGGGGKIIDLAPYLLNIIEEFNQKVCSHYGINIEADPIFFDQVKVFNMLRESKYRKTFWETYGDELLPSVFGEEALAIDEPYEITDLNVFIESGDVVIDAGANLGLFSCYAAEKGCKVYAFDPDESCIKILNEQKKLYPKIEIIPKGLSNEEGEKEFFESDDCALSSMSRVTTSAGKLKRTIVPIERLDHFVTENKIGKIDFIKADIEGEERNLLLGATEVLKNFAPKLSICTYHYPEDPILLESIIKKANANYIVKHAWRKLYAYVPK